MQTVLLPCIAKKIPHWFLPHSSTQLRIRPIWSSSIKMAAEDYTFGPYKIHHTEVFYSTNLSYAMVNLRPLLPGHILYMRFSNTVMGYKQKHSYVEFCCILILHYITYIYKGQFLHVLICPKREVKRFGDLTADETSDLWLTAQKVGRQLETYHKASSLTLAIQDGPQAGQTVPHVHIHLIPRKSGDFEKNDEIYDAMDEKEKELKQKLDLDKERKDRSLEEMSQEADEYRKLFL
ncbi:Bis(5'-adenosyl)-triphosphatase [Glycine soja]|uniref:Bis(5'-adenosyl)-triphosphatase n=1 Tax=Glycine soja TaxID=3848 RepID=A0A0B2QAI7_GLYSO|nr:Bis(5'-adenosyl)-triphosphatase [Glycine soja]